MITSGNLEKVIEIVKKATVYGEEKGGSPQIKTENKKKRQSGGKSGGKGSKGNWIPVVLGLVLSGTGESLCGTALSRLVHTLHWDS